MILHKIIGLNYLRLLITFLTSRMTDLVNEWEVSHCLYPWFGHIDQVQKKNVMDERLGCHGFAVPKKKKDVQLIAWRSEHDHLVHCSTEPHMCRSLNRR